MKTPSRAWPAALWIRKIHTYFGALFGPAILFFAISGMLQVYDLHHPQPATGYRPPAWLQMMGVLHKDQVLRAPRADHPDTPVAAPSTKHGKHGSKDAQSGADAASPIAAVPPRAEKLKPQLLSQTLLKAYVAVMAVCLVITTLLGLYLGLQSRRERWIVAGLLAAGVIAPVALMLV